MKDWLIRAYNHVIFRGKPEGRRLSPSCTVKGAVRIGRYTYVGSYAELRAVGSSLTVGNYCSIARGVKIMSAGQHHSYTSISTFPFFLIDKTLPRADFTENRGDVKIGHDVWIGVDAIIMPGVTIGNGAIIGANSVVTKDVAPYAIVAGVPGKTIKMRFGNDMCQAIEATRWWDKDYAQLRPYVDLFKKRANGLEDIRKLAEILK